MGVGSLYGWCGRMSSGYGEAVRRVREDCLVSVGKLTGGSGWLSGRCAEAV